MQAYLDGDRDLERRRELATIELDAARRDADNPDARAEAIRRAGRALALDPESAEAAAFVVKMLVEPPRELPPQLQDELETSHIDFYARAARTASFGALMYFAFLPFVLWQGVRNWGALFAVYGLVLALFAVTTYQSRTRKVWPVFVLLLNAAQMLPLSTLFGPFVFVPAIACLYAMTTSWGNPKQPFVLFVVCLASFLVPVGLQQLGWMHRVWTIEDGRIILDTLTTHIGGPATLALLILGNAGTIAIAAWFAHSMARSRDSAHRQLQIQAWQLRKLLPVEPPRPPAAVATCL